MLPLSKCSWSQTSEPGAPGLKGLKGQQGALAPNKRSKCSTGRTGPCRSLIPTANSYNRYSCDYTAVGSVGLVGALAFATRSRTTSRLRSARSAVVPGKNRHSAPVRKWLDDVVIGLGFCPWASPADEADGIRVVTSKSTTSREVFEDLIQEARGLWAEFLPQSQAGQTNQTKGMAKTTLLVCPNVKAWNRDFRYFHSFYTWHLDSGFALAESLGIKVVPFHPDFALLPRGPETGDHIMVPGPDGQDASAIVLEKNAGKDEAGEYCMAVRFANGDEGLIRHASVMAQSSDQSSDDDLCRNFTSRAPRPVLHLLRLPDLMKAEREAQRIPKKPRFEKEAKEMEVELDRMAREEARAAFRSGTMRKTHSEERIEKTDTNCDTNMPKSKDQIGKMKQMRTDQMEVADGKELAEMRGTTEAVTERNEFTIKSLGRLRLMEIMESCEDLPSG